MNDSFTSKIVVNNEQDYSNIVPKVDSIAYLVQYCDNIYKHFLTLLEEDKKRNESLKFEFKNYQYKKSYRETFEVYIIKKDYNYISCKDFDNKNVIAITRIDEITSCAALLADVSNAGKNKMNTL